MTAPNLPASGPVNPAVSVIVCTRNPRWKIFERTLNALDHQTLAKDRFELIVVDNGSQPPLDPAAVKDGRSLVPRIIWESTPGLSIARCAGIAAARADLLVFVDDDNFLARDYLEQALHIAHSEPRIGLYGGISEMRLEGAVPRWKKVIVPYLGVRNYGNQPITAFADHWGEWEPIGAGMVARREVAEKFVQMLHELPDAHRLGRSGKQLLSGEDTLFARAAFRRGYSCSYQPVLKLTHFLAASRMRVRYLARLLEGHGRSYVLLHRALGKEIDPLKMRTAISRLLHRVLSTGWAGFITWFWDIGYARERGAAPSSHFRSGLQSTVPIPRGSESDMMTDQRKPLVSVVLCTKDPRADLLDRTLDSLEKQTLPKGDFEVLVVDNNSVPPLSEQRLSQGRQQQLRVVQEPRAGHIFARSGGIAVSRADLILFVDDDNFLASDYLEQIVRIAREEPTIGAFGGIAEPEFEYPMPDWKKPLLLYLAVRNHGDKVITSFEDHWGEWEPIGAGMVVRRDVANKFIDMLENLPGVGQLGRTKRGLMSGDDSLFSRAAHRLGYACSYQPALKLTHYIKASRFSLKYLSRLLKGHGKTYVILQAALGQPVPYKSIWETLKLIPFRYQQRGIVGLIVWFWDWGYAVEVRKQQPAVAAVDHDREPVLNTEAQHHA